MLVQTPQDAFLFSATLVSRGDKIHVIPTVLKWALTSTIRHDLLTFQGDPYFSERGSVNNSGSPFHSLSDFTGAPFSWMFGQLRG